MAEIEAAFGELMSLASRHRAIADAYAALTAVGISTDGSWGETVSALDRLDVRLGELLAELADAHQEVAAALEAGGRRYDELERP